MDGWGKIREILKELRKASVAKRILVLNRLQTIIAEDLGIERPLGRPDLIFFMRPKHLEAAVQQPIPQHYEPCLAKRKRGRPSRLQSLKPLSGLSKRWLTIEQLAKQLGVSKQYVFVWRRIRVLPFIKKGRQVYFDVAEVNAWIEEIRQGE